MIWYISRCIYYVDSRAMSQTRLVQFFGSKAVRSGKLTCTKDYVKELLRLNADGTLTMDNKTHLYHDKRFKRRTRRPGITKWLQRTYFKNFKPVQKVRRLNGSGRDTGVRFHRHVFHRVMCGSNGCACVGQYGSKTYEGRIRRGSKLDRWMKQLWTVFNERRIKPFACEVIVSSRERTTEVDMLAWEEGGCLLVNVSLKTGYSVRFRGARTNDDTGKMLSHANTIDNSEKEQHQMQQFVENKLLYDGHGVKVDKNYVIYLGMCKERAVVEEPSLWRSEKAFTEKLWSQMTKK